MVRRILYLILLVVPGLTLMYAQDETDSQDRALNLRIGHSGLSIGNSVRHNGLRMNWSDRGIEQINGINLTLWKPANNPTGSINGLSLGVVGPGAEILNGISIGGIGVLGKNGINGISLGGLAVVSSGSITGVSMGGFAVVGNGGLAGVNFGGLAVVGSGSISGASFGGLAVVSKGDLAGLNFGGLAVVGLGGIKGVTVAGIGIVSRNDITGINITMGDLRSDEPEDDVTIKGFNVAAFRIRGASIVGFNCGMILTRAEESRGIVIGGYNRSGIHTGIAIGLLNHATELFGIQLGLLNIAENNPDGLRILPILNFHF